jgi:hypothetical protein
MKMIISKFVIKYIEFIQKLSNLVSRPLKIAKPSHPTQETLLEWKKNTFQTHPIPKKPPLEWLLKSY